MSGDGSRPCTPAEAVARARDVVASGGGQYLLGTGDYRPSGGVDQPWTQNAKGWGSDCAGFAICFAYKLKRHRQGFAPGHVPPAYSDQVDIDDDINVNSAIEDAMTQQELFRLVGETEDVEEGDLLCYPSVRIVDHEMNAHNFIGHVAIVVGTARAAGAGRVQAKFRQWDLLDLAECHGPDEHKPGAVFSNGAHWCKHDHDWPKPAHRSFILRVVP